MNDLKIYDDHGERYEKAYTTWLGTYVLEHPKPLPPGWWRGLPWLMIPFGIIAVAGIALSALRTAPVFADIARAVVGVELAVVEAVLAVIVIEVTMVVIRYVMVVQDAADAKPLNLRAWMRGGFWLAFAVAIIANVYATVSHLPLLADAKPIIDLVIAAVVGISAPILAFISGDVLASLWIRSEKVRSDLRSAYDTALVEWSETKDRRWASQKGNYGVRIQVEAPAPLALNAPSQVSRETSHETGRDGTARKSSYGFQRTADGETQVMNWFTEHPEDIQLSVRELEEKIGVSKSTVSRARRKWVERQNTGEN